jgi:hypothetical protein
MFVLILLMLILLIAIFAVGFTVGGRNGLPPASNPSSLSGRQRKILISPSNTNQTKQQPSISSQQATAKSAAHQNLIRRIKYSPTVIQPTVRKPIAVKPATVEKIKPIITLRSAVVIQPQKAVTVMPSVEPAVIVSPIQTVTVEPPPRGAWDERGWTVQVGNQRETYEGEYAVGNRRFHGRIEARNRGHNVIAYIHNPPPEIKRHAHGACFQQIGNDWFLLHWARPARTVDDAILYMERVLDESLNG